MLGAFAGQSSFGNFLYNQPLGLAGFYKLPNLFNSSPLAINNNQVMTGVYGGEAGGFVYDDLDQSYKQFQYVDLNGPAQDAAPAGINDGTPGQGKMQIVGWYTDQKGNHGFVATPK